MRVFGILGVLIAVVVIAFFATKTITSINSKGGIKAPVSQAEDVKEKSDLRALETKLNLFFQENGNYPNGLNELDSYGLGTTTFQYKRCSETKVSIETGNNNVVLDSGSETNDQSC